ncbi:quinate/shikimate dehydrogenase [Levilactobacillus tujiorum]|uniref:Shikimate dehydrogenase (NADP(+)) n=1 Tax=Levilactobacillus tujiorum TaxID=2912243 RepID=A0ABX1L3H4_9LACO|nr:quinate/shikimate dehydrogenase [Levilactobacillus tujiorum]MCH5464659.1 quinate/shikimate dehydrogenase [Levilactobacillus tujiorum]NLR11658.1 quinate/shikimate dehydrogenase [Lactobacillus sp. HBUAS51387]NLR29580.1 quinate/shikimate dehydrogenase [Levilactobacillus tujiorum]
MKIDGHTNLIALIAHPAGHSQSPAMYNFAFNHEQMNTRFLALDVSPADLPTAIAAVRAFKMPGVSVSMPFKQAVIPLLDRLDPTAKMIGAVNTVVNHDGVLTGYTTDGIGFVQALRDAHVPLAGKTMTLAGVGGAGTPIAIQSALTGLKTLNVFNLNDAAVANARRVVQLINDQTDCHATFYPLEDRDQFKQAIAASDLYTDATGLGMGKLIDQALVDDPTWFHPEMTVFDTVYAPAETQLMRVAQQAGVAHVLNGQGMLLNQGVAVFKLWTGHDMPVAAVRHEIFKAD